MNVAVFKKAIIQNKWLIGSGLLLLVIGYLYISKLFAFQFVDEEDNLILGHFLLQNQKLYSDLFSHHQPLAYLISALIQLIVKPTETEQLIWIHRIFMIVWSTIWGWVLLGRFREKIILPLFIYELSKYLLLGNLFLAESLVVYLVLYLVLFLLETKESKQVIEYALIGFLIGMSALLLAPLWPFLGFYTVLLVWFKKIPQQFFGVLVLGAVIPILITLPFIDLYYYFHNVFYINYRYYIPQSAEEKMPLSIIKAFFSPITILWAPNNFESLGTILKAILLIFVVSLFGLIYKKKFKLFFLVLSLLTLANIRYYTPFLDYKSGFHLIIWYGLFILFTFYYYWDFIRVVSNQVFKKVLVMGTILAILVSIIVSKNIFYSNDLKTDFDKNYSQKVVFGNAIKAMKDRNDTLFVVPDEWLLYFQGDIKNNNKMVNYYGWMSLVWELNDPVIEKFKSDPPTFFYCDCGEETVLLFSENYKQLVRNGAKTPLWILNDKFSNLSNEQKSKLRSFNFQLE